MDAALGAMSVQYVRSQFPDDAVCLERRRRVAEADTALHGNAVEAERKAWPQFFQKRIFARAAGRRVADDADGMSAFRLQPREVANMAEQPAGRLAEAVDDA